MWGSIISAGASLLGSLFGGKSKTQEVKTTVDYGEMVRGAKAAGFNPLTALRNGGSAGFTTTTSPTISNTPEILANLGGVLGESLDQKLDPINARKREPDTALVNTQLRAREVGPQMPGRLYPPVLTTGTKVSQQLVPRLGARSSTQTAAVPSAFKSDMGYKQADPPTVSNPYPNGIEPDPNTPDASVVEDRLGDDLLSPAFWYVAPRDAAHNVDKFFNDRGIPSSPYEMGRRIRTRISDWWAKPAMGQGLMRNGRSYPRPPTGGRTRSGARY